LRRSSSSTASSRRMLLRLYRAVIFQECFFNGKNASASPAPRHHPRHLRSRIHCRLPEFVYPLVHDRTKANYCLFLHIFHHPSSQCTSTSTLLPLHVTTADVQPLEHHELRSLNYHYHPCGHGSRACSRLSNAIRSSPFPLKTLTSSTLVYVSYLSCLRTLCR
jgi:hypothetical protein